MKKYFSAVLLLFCCLCFNACNTTTPEKYFDVAVLNSNMYVGFADEGMLRQIESPSAGMGKNGEVVPMKRIDELNTKIQFIEEEFEKVKDLKQTDDTKEILQNSIAVYEYILPVYKNEYTQLAKFYDGGAPKEQGQLQAKAIHDKYYAHYKELYDKLISSGKLFATKHSIKVNWQ